MKTKVQISSQIIVRPQQASKIMMGSALNFKRKLDPSDTCTRPLMVNSWSQTTGDDFKFLYDLKYKEKQTERENVFVENIRVLEENIKAHSELLSQIHATSARTADLLANPSPPVQSVKPIQIQTVESQSSTQVAYKTSQVIPKKNISNNSPTSTVMNPLHSFASTNTESVKYTIIAEGSGEDIGEPIEIQIAEEDEGFNLNSSADSGRLEICIAPEENVEIKSESDDVDKHYNAASSTKQNILKARKLGVYQDDAFVGDSDYLINNHGLSKISGANANTINISPPYQSQETYKSENYNCFANIQTTPIQSLMPSPHTNLFSLSGGSEVEGNPMATRIDTDYAMVSIGPNNTRIPAKVYDSMSWNSASIATRKLLMAVFDRKTLATHSMTGKPSPAFKDHGKPLKQMLDPMAIQDIIFAVARNCNVSEKEVRNAITTKCADENKMMKLQMNKRRPTKEVNKENIAVGCSSNLKSGL